MTYCAFRPSCFHRLVGPLDSLVRFFEPRRLTFPVGQCVSSDAWSDSIDHLPSHNVAQDVSSTVTDRLCLCPPPSVGHTPPWALVCAVVNLNTFSSSKRTAHWIFEPLYSFLLIAFHTGLISPLQRSVPNSCIGGSGTATCVRGIGHFLYRTFCPSQPPPFPYTGYSLSLDGSAPRFVAWSPKLLDLATSSDFAVTTLSSLLRYEGALNTCIGSSGAGALRSLRADTPSHIGDSLVVRAYYTTVTIVIAFFHSLLVLIGVAIAKALLARVPGMHAGPGRYIWIPISQAPIKLLLALAVASPGTPVLDWSTARPPARRPTRRSQPSTHPFVRRYGIRGISDRLLVFLVGFLTLPQCGWSMPTYPQDSAVRQFMREEFVQLGGTAADVAPQRSSDNEGAGSPAPEHLPSACIDLPKHVHGPAPYSTEHWLGVTIYAPHVAPVVCAVRANRADTVECLIERIKSNGRLPHPGYDVIVAVQPQVHYGCLTLLAYPSVIAQHSDPRSAIIIDLSRVGGHCHAAVIRSDTTAHELLQQVRLQIRADFDDEDLQVWVGDSALPASRTGTLNIAHGTLLTVMRTPFTPGTLRHVTALFTPTAQWCRVDHMPTPPQTYSLALCRGQALDPVCPAFFPWAQTADIVRSVYRLPAEDDKIVVLDNNPILDVHGEPCAQTAIAFSGPGPLSSQDILQPYFLDLRLLGESPKLVYLPVVQGEGIDLPDILAAAQVEIPRHLAGIVLQNSLRGDLQVLQIGVGPDLAHSIFSVCHEGEGTEGAVTASVPGYDQRRPADSHSSGPATHALHELVGPVPERYGQDTGPPTAHEALNLVDADVVAQWDLLPIHTCFLIFVPRFRPEYVRVTLTLPCELDDALHVVSAARDSATSVHFDNLIPVEPQPDHTFASILAVPDWVTTEVCCLIDLRALDGRLFAMVLFASTFSILVCLRTCIFMSTLQMPYLSTMGFTRYT